jgi:hypothetical protein
MVVCNICSYEFTLKKNLNKHLKEKRCNINNIDFTLLHEKLQAVGTQQINNGTNNGTINTGVINNITLNVTVNPISKLNVDYILPEKMKDLVEEYNYPKLGYLLSNYIKDMIHNKEHPENHSVKYIKKKPPTFSNTIENEEGETINVIKNLKDSCELLSEPVLANLKQKLRQCKKVFKNDADFQNVYEDTVREIYKELNKDVVKKALSTVLQTDILNDINMKIKLVTKNEN